MVSEDEQLDVSERKAEVEADDVIYHDPISSVVGGMGGKGKSKKKDAEDPDGLTDEKRLQMLEDRFLNGEISEEIYNKLRKKYVARYLRAMEDQLVDGEITEEEYKLRKEEID